MSIWKPCVCPGTRRDKLRNWRVTVRKGNYTWNKKPRGEFHPSVFSEIVCIKCGACFRSKSKYTEFLKDYTEEEVSTKDIDDGEERGIIIA